MMNPFKHGFSFWDVLGILAAGMLVIKYPDMGYVSVGKTVVTLGIWMFIGDLIHIRMGRR